MLSEKWTLPLHRLEKKGLISQEESSERSNVGWLCFKGRAVTNNYFYCWLGC